MQQTSITKLSEIYNALTNPDNTCHTNQSLANLIQEVIRAEASKPVKGSKFDIYNYVSKDANCPVMGGVFHDEGWRIASDLHIMIALKETCPEEYEHKILCKDGSFEDGKYPAWRSIIPNGTDYVPYEFDAQKFYDWIEQRRLVWKTETGKGIKFFDMWRVAIGPARLKAEFFDKLIAAMKHIGATQLFVKDARRAVYAKTDKGLVLLMPVVLDDEQEENVITLA